MRRCVTHFYEDDEVCRITPDESLEFGLITKGGLSGSNKLKILWTSDRVEGQVIDDTMEEFQNNGNDSEEFTGFLTFRLIDRKLTPGDIVEMNGKKGEVINIQWNAYLKAMETGEIIVNVPCENLEPLVKHQVGHRVELDGWLGVISSVETEASLMFTDGKSCTVDADCLPVNKYPYPGRKVKYSIEELTNAGTIVTDDGVLIDLYYDDDALDAFVMFLRIKSVEVDWKLHLPFTHLKKQPSPHLKRQTIKRTMRNIDLSHSFQWYTDEMFLLDNYYNYSLQPEDLILPGSGRSIERYIISESFSNQNFDHSNENVLPQKNKKIRAPIVVRVVRTSRIVDIQWESGEMERSHSCRIPQKFSSNQPFRQIVQMKNTLEASSSKKYGVTLDRRITETVTVEWFTKVGGGEYKKDQQTEVSTYDLEPHFLYGDIAAGEIVYRSQNCKSPERVFRFGIVKQVTADGKVIVINTLNNMEENLQPFEVVVVHINETIHKDCGSLEPVNSFHKRHISTKIGENGEIFITQESLFSPYLLRNYNLVTLSSDDKFRILPRAPKTHTYYDRSFTFTEEFETKVGIDRKLLTQVFSDGVWVKGYEDRIDLYSVMMVGQRNTPYEDGLFHFDIQLYSQYPKSSPNFYLTTNLSSDPLVGLPSGSQLFTRLQAMKVGSLLEAIVTVQNPRFLKKYLQTRNRFYLQEYIFLQDQTLILDDEILAINPNGFTVFLQGGKTAEEIRRNNSRIIIDVLDLLLKILPNPPTNWRHDIVRYIHAVTPNIIIRLSKMISSSDSLQNNELTYHLYPLSKGFNSSIQNRIERFKALAHTTAGPIL